MAWKFPGEPEDPVEKRRRQLEEQQKRLAAEMSKLEESLEIEKNPPPPTPVEPGPPVWRMEEEQSYVREEDPSSDNHRGKRVLRAQQQRDFKVFILLFVGLALIVAWLVHTFL